MTPPRRILLVEKSFGLSGSTMSLAALLNHLDGQAYAAHVVVSRPEQRCFLLQHVDGIKTVDMLAERASLAGSAWAARLLAFAGRRVPLIRRSLLWCIGVFDLFDHPLCAEAGPTGIAATH
jgi:hypothetical protein